MQTIKRLFTCVFWTTVASWYFVDVLHADHNSVTNRLQPLTLTSSLSAGLRPRRVSLYTETPPGIAEAAAEHTRRSEDYSGWLISSYIVTPVVGLGLPILLGHSNLSDGAAWTLSVSSIAVAIALPAITHWVHDETWRGWRTLIALPTITLVSGLVGILLGAALATDSNEDDDGGSGLAAGVYGALIGVNVASLAWITFDVLETASVRRDRRTAAAQSSTRVAVLPQPGGASLALLGQF
ncbi:MAG: hypothetical protein ABW321_18865 [Polyangiales bacterium]